jgi:hypothetical protein
MLPAVVVIDLEPTPPVEAAMVLVERCSEVVASSGTGGCALREANNDAEWLVRVQWSDTTLQSAQIILYRSETPLAPVRQRQLSFSLESPEQDRWESVGLLVAALVVSTRATPPPPPPPAAPPPAHAPLTRPHTSEAPREFVGHLAFAGTVGSALSDSAVQFGAKLMGDLDSPTAAVRPMLQLAYGYATDDIRLHQFGVAAGLGVPWRGYALQVEPYALLTGHLIHARVSQGARTEAATQLRWGATLGLNAFPRLDPTWSIWLGAETTLLTPKVAFELHNQPAGELGTLGWRGFLGLRAAL